MQICLTIIMVCIPLMLCVKPCYLVCGGGHADKDADEVEMTNIEGGGYRVGANDDDYERADKDMQEFNKAAADELARRDTAEKKLAEDQAL